VKDMKQPVLLSMPKARDRRRGQDTPLCFLPELCFLTGLYLSLHLYYDCVWATYKLTYTMTYSVLKVPLNPNQPTVCGLHF